MKKDLSASIPGLRFKHSTIIDALKLKEEGHIDLLAYLAFVDEFKSEIRHEQSLYNLLDCSEGFYLLHWAFGTPYPDTPGYPNRIVPIADRIAIVSTLLLRLIKENRDFTELLRRENSWGENILHVAVGADNMSDDDTCTLLNAVFDILGTEVDYSELINAINVGEASVLGYARALGKEQTVNLLQSKLDLAVQSNYGNTL